MQGVYSACTGEGKCTEGLGGTMKEIDHLEGLKEIRA
jgi:hypothetical protein